MTAFIMAHEPAIRLSFFFGVLAAMAAWESLLPRRARAVSRWERWPSNLGIVALNSVLLRLLLPGVVAGVALFGDRHGWGLLNATPFPFWAKVVLALVLLDLAIYLQHVMLHAVPVLWRLHRMHHADLDFDVTTGGRFHPIEILLALVFKLGVVAALGPPAVSILSLEVCLNGNSMLNHSNFRLTQ